MGVKKDDAASAAKEEGEGTGDTGGGNSSDEDSEADALLESSVSKLVTKFGPKVQSSSVGTSSSAAKGKASSKPKHKAAPSARGKPAASGAKVNAPASSPKSGGSQSKKSGAGSKGKATRTDWNAEEQETELQKLSTRVTEVSAFGPYEDITVAKNMNALIAKEKKRQRDAQTLLGDIEVAFTANKEFRLNASEAQMVKACEAKEITSLIFKICKGFCQNSMTSPAEYAELLAEAADDYELFIPSHFWLQMMKHKGSDAIKFCNYDNFSATYSGQDAGLTARILHGGATLEALENFSSGQIEA